MDASGDRLSLFATVATWLTLGLLGILVLAIGVGLFPLSDSLALENPEFANLQTPLLTLSLGVCLCVEAILIATATLVGHIRRDRIFSYAAARMVDILVITVIVATILTALIMPLIPGPPALGILVVGCVLVGIALSLVLVVLRSLLRRAVLMRVELDEVV